MQTARNAIEGAQRAIDHLGIPPAPPPNPDPALTRRPAMVRDARDLAALIEHTNLKPDTTLADIRALCSEAKDNEFCGVCVVPRFVSEARRSVGSTLKVVTVVGFPSGAVSTQAKVADVNFAAEADEFDMVIDIGMLKEGAYAGVYQDIRAVRDAVRALGDAKRLKVIVESGLLKPDELAVACLLSRRAGADFVKTSTGFNSDVGARPQAVALMRECVGNEMGIKASAGIRDWESAADLIAAGANRLGTSASVAIVNGATRVAAPSEPGIDSSLEAVLEHGRDLFRYHAGQRLTSIRYFVIAMSFFGVAWTTILNSATVGDHARGVALWTLGLGSV